MKKKIATYITMITKMNYLLLSSMMVVAIDSTFGRGCDCCKKLCGDKNSNGSSINNVDNKIIVNEQVSKGNGGTIPINNNDKTYDNNNTILANNIENNYNSHNTNENNNFSLENFEKNNNIENINVNNNFFQGNNIGDNNNSNHELLIPQNNDTNEVDKDEEKETLYFKIDEAAIGEEDIKKYFGETWYNARTDKVLLLQKVNENDTGVLNVTGSGDKWKITDPQRKVLGGADFNPNNNKWIIVKVTTLQEDSKSAGDSLIFYVDDITSIADDVRVCGVFDNVGCYSIEIIAANTSTVENMSSMFYFVESALEKDGKTDTGPGLIGLEKLNVENVTNMDFMFTSVIHKQATLEQLGKWHFSGENWVRVDILFFTTAKGLDFTVLNGWSKSKNGKTVSFWRSANTTNKDCFVEGDEGNFTELDWFESIGGP